MRFIWKVVQHDVGGPIDHKNEAQLAISETSEAAVDAKKNRENMKAFLEGIEKQPQKEKQDFDKKLTEWYQKGDKVSMRMAGVSEDENDPLKSKEGYLQRHKKLSSAFVTWEGKEGKLGGKINFKENETAESKVGLGDMLPPNAKGVSVEKKSGEKVYCIRAQNPQTGRIGYYEAEALAKGQYLYVAVHTGDTFEVTRTIDPNDPKAQRAFLREHLAVYKKGAMESDGGEEVYYDNYGVALPGTPAATKAYSEGAIKSDSSKRLAALQQTIVSPGKPLAPTGKQSAPPAKPSAPRVTVDTTTKELIEINKKQYQRLTRQFLERNIGTTQAETSRWLVPTTFLEQKISVSPLILPYLKEVESRIKAAGIDYKLNPAAGGCQCYSHRGMRKLDGSFSDKLSNHSWGIALDINPGDHPFGQKWEDNHNPNKMPMEVVKIFEECGFHWGNDFLDAMHMEFAVNPFTSLDIIQSEEGKKAIDVMEQFCGNLGNDTRAAWNKPKVAPQAPILPQEGNQKSTNVIAHHTNEGKNKVTLEMMESDHRQNAANIKIKPETLKALERFREKALRNKFRYEQVAQATGVPWFLIAAIHEREAGGNFNSYLHNGDPLGKPTIHVPAGKLFYDWETAAIDAIKSIGLTQKLGLTPETKDMGLLLTYAERYNGLGYRKPELGTTSPYVYAGTNMYEKGKYVRDGVYDPNVVDKQLGVAAMILALNGTEDYGHIDKNKAVA